MLIKIFVLEVILYAQKKNPFNDHQFHEYTHDNAYKKYIYKHCNYIEKFF